MSATGILFNLLLFKDAMLWKIKMDRLGRTTTLRSLPENQSVVVTVGFGEHSLENNDTSNGGRFEPIITFLKKTKKRN